ncbi:MAG: hypothetical protein ACP5NV_05715 [Candidatus Woesearchaeota archaeon]
MHIYQNYNLRLKGEINKKKTISKCMISSRFNNIVSLEQETTAIKYYFYMPITIVLDKYLN